MESASGSGDRPQSDWSDQWISADQIEENRTWSRRFTEPPPEFAVPPPTFRGSGDTAGDRRTTPVAPRRRRRAGLVVGSVAVIIIVVATVVGVATTGGNQQRGSSGSVAISGQGANRVHAASMTPAAFVVSSTQNTLSQQTADITISGNVSADGQSIPLSGSGYANFKTGAFWVDMTIQTPSGLLDEHEIVFGGQLYFGLDGQGFDISQITGGPHWIDVPVPEQDSSDLGSGNVDPQVQLEVLDQKGANVEPLGTSQVGGETVSGYAVTPSQAEEQEALQQEVQSGGVPLSTVPMLEQELQALGTPTMHVYFDASSLLRQLSVTFGGGSSPVSASVTMNFDDYGTTVSIEPPVSSDVISYAQFVQDVQASQTPVA